MRLTRTLRLTHTEMRLLLAALEELHSSGKFDYYQDGHELTRLEGRVRGHVGRFNYEATLAGKDHL